MRDEKGKITVKSVWKWLRSSQGKKYSFVIFYAIFFIFLFIFISMPADYKPNNKQSEEEVSSFPFTTKRLENDDYNFVYKEIINEKEISFSGVKENNTISISDSKDKYDYIYQNGELSFMGELNPLNYYKLLSIYNIKALLKDGILVTKAEFPRTKEYEFYYDIESYDLGEFFEIDYDGEESLNRMIVNCDADLEVKKITFDIVNFLKGENQLDTETNSYMIELNYEEEA